MVYIYGTKQVALTTRDVGEDEAMESGKVYEANYAISGLRTVVPGWENDAINEVVRNVENSGGEVIYVAIDTSGSNKYVKVQWKMKQTANATAMVLPVIAVYAIAIAVITICAIWLVLTLTGSVKEIGTLLTDNSELMPLAYGLLIIGGMIAFSYLLKNLGYGRDSDHHEKSSGS